jgi:predicted glycoside hydrolase/deacetylase ChbG (UPF0249 family)
MPAAGERHLIVNADDFGLTSGINRGIIEAHEHGIVTSASLMVRYPTAQEAASYARAHPELSVGLHFEAAEWRYRDGEWYAAYEVVSTDDETQIRAELDRQLAAFIQLLGRQPTHLDSHQHVHQSEPARSIMLECAERLNVPLRSCTSAIAYNGNFYGQTGEGDPFHGGISLTHLREMITALPSGWTEFGCHAGYAENLDSVYAAEREEELRVLCSSEVRRILDANCVHLCSFHDFNSARSATEK